MSTNKAKDEFFTKNNENKTIEILKRLCCKQVKLSNQFWQMFVLLVLETIFLDT